MTFLFEAWASIAASSSCEAGALRLWLSTNAEMGR